MNYSNEILLTQIAAKCAHPNSSSAQHFQAGFYLGLHLLGLLPHLLVLPATAKLAKKRTAFCILLNINIMHILIMFWTMELYLGHFVGHRIAVPLDLDAIVYQICAMAVAVAYNLLELNRIIAIMAPIFYFHLFTLRFTRLCLSMCWFCGIVFSVVVNWKPYLRIYSCIYTLVSIYPPAIITENNLHFKLIDAVNLINLTTTSYTPTALYAICLIWRIVKKVLEGIGNRKTEKVSNYE
ncbi:hypothetical protein niasHS_005989 [Heterodera schachtii]|uniref:G-protein coupled receptors family 1 profile domain-containing protein n=2 Tax=Heterodera TaxID=34509 RepID=A0ABD2JN38_HETSC